VTETRPVDQRKPWPTGTLTKTAWICLQLLVIAAAVWVAGQVFSMLAFVTMSVTIALLLAAVFSPAVDLLDRRGLPRGLATAVVLIVGLAAVGALVTFVVRAMVAGLPDLASRLTESLNQLRDWLTSGPLGLSAEEIDGLVKEAESWFSRNRSELASGVLGTLSTLGSVLAGLALALFLLIFFVHSGGRMWNTLVSPFPEPTRGRFGDAGRAAFRDLGAFVRATVAVALIDAVGIGLGLWITGVPLVVPLAALVFLGAFVPIIGAFVSGLVAVLVALVSQGFVVALIVVGVVIAVQQLEGNLFEPLLVSRTVRLHPVAVLLTVAVGVEVAGIAGAVLAVPVFTTIRAFVRTLLPRDERAGSELAT
jgi:putative heme transporter